MSRWWRGLSRQLLRRLHKQSSFLPRPLRDSLETDRIPKHFSIEIRELSLEPKVILFPRNQPQWINSSYADTVKTFRRSDSFESIPPRIGQAAFQVEPRNLHLAANSRNQHEQPRICILKVEE